MRRSFLLTSRSSTYTVSVVTVVRKRELHEKQMKLKHFNEKNAFQYNFIIKRCIHSYVHILNKL